MKLLPMLLIAVVCVASSAEDQVVSNKEIGFEITFPETWVQNPKNISATLLACADNGERKDATLTGIVHVYAPKTAAGTTLKDAAAKEAGSGNTSRKTGETEITNVKLAGQDAVKLTYAATTDYPNNVVKKTTCYFVYSGKRMLKLFIQCMSPGCEKHSKDIDAIVKSFKLLPVK